MNLLSSGHRRRSASSVNLSCASSGANSVDVNKPLAGSAGPWKQPINMPGHGVHREFYIDSPPCGQRNGGNDVTNGNARSTSMGFDHHGTKPGNGHISNTGIGLPSELTDGGMNGTFQHAHANNVADSQTHGDLSNVARGHKTRNKLPQIPMPTTNVDDKQPPPVRGAPKSAGGKEGILKRFFFRPGDKLRLKRPMSASSVNLAHTANDSVNEINSTVVNKKPMSVRWSLQQNAGIPADDNLPSHVDMAADNYSGSDRISTGTGSEKCETRHVCSLQEMVRQKSKRRSTGTPSSVYEADNSTLSASDSLSTSTSTEISGAKQVSKSASPKRLCIPVI